MLHIHPLNTFSLRPLPSPSHLHPPPSGLPPPSAGLPSPPSGHRPALHPHPPPSPPPSLSHLHPPPNPSHLHPPPSSPPFLLWPSSPPSGRPPSALLLPSPGLPRGSLPPPASLRPPSGLPPPLAFLLFPRSPSFSAPSSLSGPSLGPSAPPASLCSSGLLLASLGRVEPPTNVTPLAAQPHPHQAPRRR